MKQIILRDRSNRQVGTVAGPGAWRVDDDTRSAVASAVNVALSELRASGLVTETVTAVLEEV